MTLVTFLPKTLEPLTSSSSWLGVRHRSCAEQASDKMLQLFRTNLEVRLQCIDPDTLSDHQKQILTRIADMRLSAPTSATDCAREWDDAYKLERLSAMLFNGPQLRYEIARRIKELAVQSAFGSEAFQHEYEKISRPAQRGKLLPVDDGILRAFLLRLIEAIQWTAKKQYLAQPVRKQAAKKIIFGVFVAFVMLVVPYLVLSLDYRDTDPLSPWWTHLALYTALFSGALGAFFSRLMLLQRNSSKMTLEEVCFHNEWSYTLLRASVGMCGALILFYFFMSGMIEGSLFPSADNIAINLLVVKPPGLHMAFATPSKDLAQLTVWCILAGFSELLVPNLLGKTERQLTGTASFKTGSE